MEHDTTTATHDGILVRIDGEGMFSMPPSCRATVVVLSDDLVEAILDRDRVRYETDLWTLQRVVRTFGRFVHGAGPPDVVLPAPEADLDAARTVVHPVGAGEDGWAWSVVPLAEAPTTEGDLTWLSCSSCSSSSPARCR